MPQAEFWRIERDPELRRAALGRDEPSLEGWLHPATYSFGIAAPVGAKAEGADAGRIAADSLARMADASSRVLGGAWRARKADCELDFRQAAILASIVERESADPTERRLASSVFINRLTRGMKLQSCATVLYCLPADRRSVRALDLGLLSRYNTYRWEGLPPGPICSPSLDSFMAVLEPAESDYLFFALGSDGRHVFSPSPAEHENAARRIAPCLPPAGAIPSPARRIP